LAPTRVWPGSNRRLVPLYVPQCPQNKGPGESEMHKTFAVLLWMASSTLPYGQLPGSTINGRVTDPHKVWAEPRTPSSVVLYFHGPPWPSIVVYPTKGTPKPTTSNSLSSVISSDSNNEGKPSAGGDARRLPGITCAFRGAITRALQSSCYFATAKI